jgi:hypothetical protein
MTDCPAFRQSGTGMKKITMSETVQYRTKPRQSDFLLVWYRTKIIDAGMPMPALVSWIPMLMLSYGKLSLFQINMGAVRSLLFFHIYVYK